MTNAKNKSDAWYGSWEALIQRVVTDQVVDADRAVGTAKIIAELDPSLRPAFLLWLKTGEINLDFAVGDYSISEIFKRQGAALGISGAFTFLDGLVKNPNETIGLLEQKYHLYTRGDEERIIKQ